MKTTMEYGKLCYGCMEMTDEGICPNCGFERSKEISEPYHLPMGSLLADRYLIGRVLGEGGFGITYIGWDKSLEIKVAIKEFYPSGLVTRELKGQKDGTVSVYTGDKRESFSKGLERFLNETRRLAKFRNSPGIVGVSDFFEENGTAYMVMDYVSGINMSQYLKQRGDKIPVEQVLKMFMPVIRSLEEVHQEGIIHRDISPDNIMVQNNGEIRLIDFGAARDFSDSNKSLSIVLKPGYAPEEQYRSKGNQGPWTDVYALCATMYKMITGITPEESMERIAGMEIKKPSEMNIAISSKVENTIMLGMEIKAENRIQSMNDLIRSLDGEEVRKNVYIQSKAVSDIDDKTEFIENNINFEQLQRNREDTLENSPVIRKRSFKKAGAVILALIAVTIVIGSYAIGTRNTGEDTYTDETTTSATLSDEERYGQAAQMYEQGKYQEAAALYQELGDYSDSGAKYKEAMLKYGESEYLNKNYETAIGTLEQIGEFNNAKELLSKSYFEYGKSLSDVSEYEKAIAVFQKSSEAGKEEEIKLCTYNNAVAMYKDNKKKKAAAAFKELGDYEDSASYYGKCMKKYWSGAYKKKLSQFHCSYEESEDDTWYYYSLYDIDKNGIPELLIELWYGDMFQWMQIFTFDGVELLALDDRLGGYCYARAIKEKGIILGTQKKMDENGRGDVSILKVNYENGGKKEEILHEVINCDWEGLINLLDAYGQEIESYKINEMTPFKKW